ncbi:MULTISPECIES: hypothetical protein [Pseudomonas]|uniref:Uncharacterized protein n=1 Tax=Pseudomonas putida (strain DOT-T1E) TaxID=1196325 RepID=I7C6D2_PSEPT|nr:MULTISPECIES: hypothetical protein [Pseudomonas]AFO47244.1 hypothetical protein T1E_1389 [Pseudomonas putida DOT-T1E]UZM95203.1 hypothetical protein OPZ46_07215 [Pseudomonas putida DOT-T1E]WPO32114.1 hypothetical protein REH59_10845 [Pseudomonas sp. BO3-4]
MSISEEHFQRACEFADQLITEKSEWLRRALKAERERIVYRALAIAGWLGVITMAITWSIQP